MSMAMEARLKNYKVLELINSSSRSLVYRGKHVDTEEQVAIKVLNQRNPLPEDIARLEHEFRIIKLLDFSGVIKTYAMEKTGALPALVLEYGGGNLTKLIAGGISIEHFLEMAIQITQIMGKIHDRRVTHKGINPANILWDPVKKDVKIIDFGNSSELFRERQKIRVMKLSEDTLPYISPEQTHRMNCEIDYRTDFYSLGITLFELLTGQRPYQANNALGWIHCHIAKKPVSPIALRPEIPPVLGDLLLKLLEKNPEHRYQSTFGLLHDLKEIKNQWAAGHSVESFDLGKFDASGIFRVPQRLYGRDDEIALVLNIFNEASKGNPQLVLVAGYSGVGKTSLIREVQKSILGIKGYFIEGKYDQFKQNVPYRAIIQAFQDLVQQILTESDDRLAIWKSKFSNALGANGQVVLDMIPEFESIIGAQAPVPELYPKEIQNRLIFTFRELINVITGNDRPLVIFLDDLQWSDRASLDFIKNLLNIGGIRNVLIIGAYRDSEVDSGHPLRLTFDEIIKTKSVRQLSLRPLIEATVNRIVSDTLHVGLGNALPLAKLVFQKTKGNPFFINELLAALYQEGKIEFRHDLSRWIYHQEAIESTAISENVVVFLTDRLKKMSPAAQELLGFASFLGNNFNLNTLFFIDEQSGEIKMQALQETIREGILIPQDEYFHLPLSSSSIDFEQPSVFDTHLSFHHDRLQQAASNLIPAPEKPEIHLRIGRFMLENLMPMEADKKIIEIVRHLNEGKHLIHRKKEKTRTAELNLISGKKAKESAAFKEAGELLKTGLDFLDGDVWTEQYDLALQLYTENSEIAYLNGRQDELEAYSKAVIDSAENPLDMLGVYRTKMIHLTTSNKLREAIQLGTEILKYYGVSLPRNDHPFHVIRELLKVKIKLRKKDIEKLIELPKLTDPQNLAAADILARCIEPCYMGYPGYLPIVVFRLLYLSITRGNSVFSPHAYSTYGAMLCGYFGKPEQGFLFGEMSLAVAEKYNAIQTKCKINFVFAGMIYHWTKHIRGSLDLLISAAHYGEETGDLSYGVYGINFYIFHLFALGEPLANMKRKLEAYSDRNKEMHSEVGYRTYGIAYQMVLALLGETADKYELNGERCRESELL